MNGKIPTEDDGFVPEQAIQKRYREYYRMKQAEYDGRRLEAMLSGKKPAPAVNLAKRDYSTTADVVIPLKCTPEQIAAWWDDPSCCDVQDVDCAGPPKVNVPKGMTMLQKRDQGRIRVIATPLEEQRLRRELVRGFEPGDVSKIAASSPIIQVRPMSFAATGSYSPSGNRVTVDRDRGLRQRTVVHELSHQLRATDPHRRGPVVTANPDRNIEESCTVAEQMARSDEVDYSGYYMKACVYDRRTCRWRGPTPAEARRMAEEDHMLFTEGRGRGLKGNSALRSVERHWAQSHIARLRMHGNKMAVNRMADETGAVERVSMAKPRTAKEAEERRDVPLTNMTAGRPGAAADVGRLPRGPRLFNGNDIRSKRNPMSQRYLVLIDESGDPGQSENSSREFTMTASINKDSTPLEKIVDETPKGTRFPKDERYSHELKHSSSSDDVRMQVLNKYMMSKPSVYAVHISKNELKGHSSRAIYVKSADELMRDVLSDKVFVVDVSKADFVFDSCNYLNDKDAERVTKNAAKRNGVEAVNKVERHVSSQDKSLQAHDFLSGAIGMKYNAGDETEYNAIKEVTKTRTIHMKKQ